MTSTVLALVGSLRKNSMNALIVAALPALAPKGMTIVEFDVSQIPLYNQDDDTDTPPEAIAALRAAVAEADAIVIATPEYNHSIPAVTKNFIDWASRPFMNGVLTKKNIMLLVCGPVDSSGSHGLAATREVLTLLGNTVSTALTVGGAHKKITSTDGVVSVVDSDLAQQLRDGLVLLAD